MIRMMIAGLGAVTAAVGSALCCAGPLVAVALGVSGAGLAATAEPLRPWFLAGAGLFLGTGFFVLRREERNACTAGRQCADPVVRSRMRRLLYVATAIAIIFMTWPTWSRWVF